MAVATVTALAAACSVLVTTDEEDLVPRWCPGPPILPVIDFPRPSSGVLGVVPIWGEYSDCSGIRSVSVQVRSDVRVAQGDQIDASIEDTRFWCFWDTTGLAVGESPWLQVEASPVRDTIPAQLSVPLRVTVFGFETAEGSSSTVGHDNWAFVDFDGDGQSDLLWNGTLYTNGGTWPFERDPEAFDANCRECCLSAGCTGLTDCCEWLRDDEGLGWLAPRFPLAVADLDGDGVLDLLHGGVSAGGIFLASGVVDDGRWRAGSQRLLLWDMEVWGPHGNGAALVSDVDLDGLLDILLTFPCESVGGGTCIDEQDVNLLLHGQSRDDNFRIEWVPVEGLPSTLRRSNRDGPATAADVLGDDGYPEILVTHSHGRSTDLYRNLGGEPPWFALVDLPQPLQASEPVQVVDFDLDGRLDIVFPFETDHQPPTLWRQVAGDVVSFLETSTLVGYPGGVLADVNNDGLLDAGGAIGTPSGDFVVSGVEVVGYPVDAAGPGRNPSLDFLRGPGLADLSRSTLTGTDRLVVRVLLPHILPFNRFGIGSRIRVSRWDPDNEEDGGDGWELVGSGEIGAWWAGALPGFDFQLGTDRFTRYRVEVRLPMRSLITVDCEAPGNAVVLVTEVDGAPACTVQ
jgi:hypothetical protein